MQVSGQELDGFTQIISFQFEAEEMDKKLNREFKKIGSRAKIPGFRKGKVPLKIIHQQYGASVINEMQSNAINDSWSHIVQELKFNPLSMPDLKVTQPLRLKKGLNVTFSFDIIPPFDLPSPETISGEQITWTIGDARIDQELDRLCERLGDWIDLKRRKKCREADLVKVNIKAMDGDETLEDLSIDDKEIELGQEQELPEVEKAIIGLKVEETFSVDFTFPEDAAEQFAGRTVQFTGEVLNIQEKSKASIDKVLEQFPEEDEEALRARIKEELVQHMTQKSRTDLRESVIEQLTTKCDFPVPPSVVENMTQEQLNRNKGDDDTDESHSEEELEATRQKVTQNLRFEAIVFEYSRANNITVNEADFTKHLLELIQSAGEFGMQLFNFYRQPANRARLEQIILDEKVIDSYIDAADLADVEQELGLDEES